MKSVIEILLDLVELGALYVPAKEYSRVGDKVKDKTNNFKYSNAEYTPIINMTISEDKLNASILFKVNGFVEVGENTLGLPQEIDTFMFRTHTIIKEGKLNMNSIRYMLPDIDGESENKLEPLENSIEVESGVYEIDLTSFPIYKDIVAYSAIETIYEVEKDLIRTKLLDKYLKQFFDKDFNVVYSPEQQEYLSTFGIQKDGSYRPLEIEVVEKSTISAFEFKTYIKGASTIPSIKALKESISKKKDFNVVEIVAKDIFEKFEGVEQEENLKKYWQNKKDLFNLKTILLRAKLELLDSNYKVGLDSVQENTYKKDFEDGTLILTIKK